MDTKKSIAVISIVVGVAILGLWAWLLVQQLVPSIAGQPYLTFGHLFADFVTVVMLLLAAYGLLAKKEWAGAIHLVSAGLLLYSGIMGTGYFAQQRDQPAFTALFALLALVALGFLVVELITPPPSAHHTPSRSIPPKGKSTRR